MPLGKTSGFDPLTDSDWWGDSNQFFTRRFGDKWNFGDFTNKGCDDSKNSTDWLEVGKMFQTTITFSLIQSSY